MGQERNAWKWLEMSKIPSAMSHFDAAISIAIGLNYTENVMIARALSHNIEIQPKTSCSAVVFFCCSAFSLFCSQCYSSQCPKVFVHIFGIWLLCEQNNPHECFNLNYTSHRKKPVPNPYVKGFFLDSDKSEWRIRQKKRSALDDDVNDGST